MLQRCRKECVSPKMRGNTRTREQTARGKNNNGVTIGRLAEWMVAVNGYELTPLFRVPLENGD